MKIFTADKKTNLKDFTDCVFPQGGFCLARLLKNRDVKVNGVRVSGNVALDCGDEVAYYTSLKQESLPSHKSVYEDENIFIADKFSGVNTEGLLSELCGKGEFFAVHRLDRNTQGLIVFAKNKDAQDNLLEAFKTRRVGKTYIALCKNCFTEQSGTLTAYLKKDEKNSTVKIYGRQVEGGLKIITEYSVAEVRGDVALVSVTLHTGRTHQIRAHLAYIGCPVLGDEKYGDGKLNKKYGLTRQCLVSKTLTFGTDGCLEYLNGKKFTSSFGL